jgi:hypothetical protein
MSDNQFLTWTYDQALATYQAEMLEAQADFQRASVTNDAAAAADAARQMADIRVRAGEFDRMCREHAQQLAAAPKPHPHGLSNAEVEAARVAGVTDAEYAEGKRHAFANQRFSWQQQR